MCYADGSEQNCGGRDTWGAWPDLLTLVKLPKRVPFTAFAEKLFSVAHDTTGVRESLLHTHTHTNDALKKLIGRTVCMI